jgi:hypothetical protein
VSVRKRVRQQVVGAIPFSSALTIGRSPTAKLDFITLGLPLGDDHPPELFDLLSCVDAEGRLELPRRSWESWMTIHDPTVADLQGLLDYYADGEVVALELAMDYRPRSPSRSTLENLNCYLYHAIYPNRLPGLAKAARHRFNGHEPPCYDLSPPDPSRTAYWKEPRRYFELKLYIKDEARGAKVPVVRVELRLNRGGCQDMKISRVAQLPSFAGGLRRAVNDAFTVAKGAKFDPVISKSNKVTEIARVARTNKRERKRREVGFTEHGVAWCVKHSVQVAPDAGFTRLTGGALQRLAKTLARVVFRPEKRKLISGVIEAERLRYQVLE